MQEKVLDTSEKLHSRAIRQAVCKPIDRHTTLLFLDIILNLSNLERQEFIIHNFEKYPKNYSVRLMSCIPEFWEELNYEKLLELISFAHNSSKALKRFIVFTHKFLRINIFPFIYEKDYISDLIKNNIQEYFLTNTVWLFKDKIDDSELFYNQRVMGIELSVFEPIIYSLLDDKRIPEAFVNVEDVKKYLHNI